MGELKVGLFGVGRMGSNHLRVLSGMDGVAVRAYDPGAAFCPRAPSAVMVPGAGELMRWADAVVVATPIPAHYGIAKNALLNGKPVLCEKPVCGDIDQLRHLMETSRARNVLLMGGYVERYNPAVGVLCDRGRASVAMVEMERVGNVPEADRVPCGVVMDIAVHDYDLLSRVFPGCRIRVVHSSLLFDGTVAVRADVVLGMRWAGRDIPVHVRTSWVGLRKRRLIGLHYRQYTSFADLVNRRVWTVNRMTGRRRVRDVNDGRTPLEIELDRFVGMVKDGYPGGPVHVGEEAVRIAEEACGVGAAAW